MSGIGTLRVKSRNYRDCHHIIQHLVERLPPLNSFMTEVLSYRNQSIYLICKSTDLFLYERTSFMKVKNKKIRHLFRFLCTLVIFRVSWRYLSFIYKLHSLNDSLTFKWSFHFMFCTLISVKSISEEENLKKFIVNAVSR